MKKVIPVVIAIALIAVIAVTSFGKAAFEKYSYGHDVADLNDYFQLFGDDDVAIILDNAKTDFYGRVIDGKVYFDRDTLEEFLTTRFYYDPNETLLLYSTPTSTIEAVLEASTASDIKTGESINLGFPISVIADDNLYIALDYVKNFVNFDYRFFDNPNRMELILSERSDDTAVIKKDTQVRWKGGVKSEILREIGEGTEVTVIERMDEWTKVMTDDCFIGYVENKRLGDESTKAVTVEKTAPEEVFTYLTRDHKINLTWHNIEYPQGGSDLRAALQNTKALNVVSPTWFWLTDNDGSLGSVANSDYSDAAHDMGLEVWALVSNFHSGADVDTYEVLAYTSKRRALVSNLVATALSYGADGINVDFENMNSDTTPHFVQFVRELAQECHANNLVLSSDNYVPTEYTAHYNRGEQGLFADYIIIMGYDEHYIGSPEAGSVSSIPWMEKGIKDTIARVPKERVINAVPFYTRVWMTEGGDVSSEAVTMQVSNEFLSKNGIETVWDESTYQNYGEKTMGGVFYQVWMEDADSLSVRLNVMNAQGVAGVASWKLGQETPDIWDVIEKYMN